MNPHNSKPLQRLGLALGFLLALCPAAKTVADVKLPALFSEHMVLQEGKPAPVWGWADPGEEVVVSIAGQTKTTRAAKTGKWLVKLAPIPSGGPFTLHVKGKNDLAVEDVLVGEVWLGSGQSNMAHPAAEARDFEGTKAAADLPAIRMFKVESKGATNAQDDCVGSWKVCSADTVGRFSAVLFFFGRELHKSLGVPVGLINSSVGATAIESWISPEAQKAKHGEGELFNGKIAPLIPYALGGAIWYQGEANARSPEQARKYHTQLVRLVKDWRARWGYPFPFAWAQLPNFSGRAEAWCLVREGQLQALELPRTGMAITVDIGDSGNIHPKNKQETGRRLSLWALGTVYGRPVTATSGPLPAGRQFRAHEVVLKFTHTEGGLLAQGGELKGFTIAGKDRQWQPAQARIVGETIIVSHPAIAQPAAVRYAWQDNPDCNLYNGAGLPASPFRTDDWP